MRVIGEARLHEAWFPCSGRRYRNAPSLLVVGFKQFSVYKLGCWCAMDAHVGTPLRSHTGVALTSGCFLCCGRAELVGRRLLCGEASATRLPRVVTANEGACRRSQNNKTRSATSSLRHERKSLAR